MHPKIKQLVTLLSFTKSFDRIGKFTNPYRAFHYKYAYLQAKHLMASGKNTINDISYHNTFKSLVMQLISFSALSFTSIFQNLEAAMLTAGGHASRSVAPSPI